MSRVAIPRERDVSESLTAGRMSIATSAGHDEVMTAIADAVSDADCLDRWIDGGDAEAFATLARRHVDVVYAAARRQLAGDASAADDVTQAVFVVLARRAAQARRARSLAAWLYVVTRHAVANARRATRRRAIHESRAAALRPEATMPTYASDDLRPLIDDAIAALGEADRVAIVERYLNGRDVADVAQVLGAGVGATQKRIERAIAKLRVRLAPGVSAATVTAALAARADAAPAHLVERAAAPGARSTLADATLAAMKPSALATGSAIVALAAAAIVAAVVVESPRDVKLAAAPVATTPTTAAAPTTAASVDLSTPLAAALTLLRSIDRADETAMRGVTLADDDGGRRILAAQLRAARAQRALADAARERIGADAVASVRADVVEMIERTRTLPEASIVVVGDRADVPIADGGPATPMVRAGDAWQFDIAEYSRRCRMSIDDEEAQARALAAADEAVAARVRSGEITTARELSAARSAAREQH